MERILWHAARCREAKFFLTLRYLTGKRLLSTEQLYTDATLLQKIAGGDEGAYRSVFDRFYVPLCSFARVILNDGAQSEDVVQEAFCKLWDRKTSLSAVHNLRAFLYTMVRNACFDYLRQEKRQSHLQETSGETQLYSDAFLEAAVLQEEVLQIIISEIDALPDHYATVLKMLFIEGLDYRQISSRLQIPVATLRKQKERALQQLRQAVMARQALNTAVLAPPIIFLLNVVTKS